MYRERKFEEADRSENLDVDGKIILKYILNNELGRMFHLNRNRGSGGMVWTQERTFESFNL